MFPNFQRFQWPSLTLDEIKKRARIVVIDDDDFVYKELFIRDGYTLDKWDDVDDLSKLEKGYYDIILLDIQGVGKECSADQGLGVLRHLRQVCPTQLIIAYSNADWSLKYQQFFDLADTKLGKSQDYVEFKRAVDKLLQIKFSYSFYFEKIFAIVSSTYPDKTEIDKQFQKTLKTSKLEPMVAFLQRHMLKKDSIELIIQIVQVALTIHALGGK